MKNKFHIETYSVTKSYIITMMMMMEYSPENIGNISLFSVCLSYFMGLSHIHSLLWNHMPVLLAEFHLLFQICFVIQRGGSIQNVNKNSDSASYNSIPVWIPMQLASNLSFLKRSTTSPRPMFSSAFIKILMSRN